MVDEPISYTLLENGLDFILSAIEHLSETPNKRELKYAILHLHSGIELILKERLRREHWSLVFEKVEEAKKEKYTNGDFMSVQWRTCLGRLKGICEVDISEVALRTLEELKKKRNRLEHFNIVDSEIALKSATVPVITFALQFINDVLGEDTLTEEELQSYNKIRQGLGDFELFVADRWKGIEDELKQFGNLVVTCPRCFQDAMAVDDGATCYFCGFHIDELDKTIQEFVNNVLDVNWRDIASGDEWPVYRCPSCEDETLILIRDNYGTDKPAFLCFRCGASWENLSSCMTCGNYFDDTEGIGICDDCIQYKVNKND